MNAVNASFRTLGTVRGKSFVFSKLVYNMSLFYYSELDASTDIVPVENHVCRSKNYFAGFCVYDDDVFYLANRLFFVKILSAMGMGNYVTNQLAAIRADGGNRRCETISFFVLILYLVFQSHSWE